jgi:hypothetical protein
MLQLIRKLFNRTREVGKYVGTFRTQDAAFTFRMPTGFPGTVNRTHPASIEPCLIDPSAPPLAYGIPLIIDATSQGVRPFTVGDTGVTAAYGFAVRPYPIQQQSATNYGSIAFGAAVPPASQPMDVLKSGYILATLNNFAVNNSTKDGAVYVWCAATSGQHVQGQLEAVATGGSTAALSIGSQQQTYFNGPAGPDGVVEVAFNL